jgi:hypothetical protein
MKLNLGSIRLSKPDKSPYAPSSSHSTKTLSSLQASPTAAASSSATPPGHSASQLNTHTDAHSYRSSNPSARCGINWSSNVLAPRQYRQGGRRDGA